MLLVLSKIIIMSRFLSILLSFCTSLTCYSQSIYSDIQKLSQTNKTNGCIEKTDILSLKVKYQVTYAELRSLKYQGCFETSFIAKHKQLMGSLKKTNAQFEETNIKIDKLKIEVQQTFKIIEAFVADFDFLNEEDIEAILGASDYNDYLLTVNEFNMNLDDLEKKIKLEESVDSEAIGEYRGIISDLFFSSNMNVGSSGSGAKKSAALSFLPTSPSFIVDATAQFLVSKTKQELNARFIEQMRTMYKEHVDFQELFTATSNILLYADPLSFSTWSVQLQLSLKKDVLDLSYTLPNYLKKENKLFTKLEAGQREMLDIALMAFQATQNNQRGYSPARNIQILEEYFGVRENQKENINCGLTIINSLVESFTDDGQMISSRKIMELGAENSLLNTFRLLYTKKYGEKLRLIQLQNGKNLLDAIVEDEKLNFVNQLLLISTSMGNEIEKINKQAEREKEAFNMTMALNNMLPVLFENSIQTIALFNGAKNDKDQLWMKRFRPMVVEVVDMNNQIIAQNYKGTLISASNIMLLVLNDVFDKLDEKDKEAVSATKSTIKTMIYWTGFMSDFLALDGTQSMSDLLMKYAENNSSYRVKRSYNSSLSLNAYPGIYNGNEQFNMRSNLERYNNAFAVSAPVGINWMFSVNKTGTKSEFDYVNKKNNYVLHSGLVHGLFFPIVDLGAPFAYRWSNDDASGFSDDLKWSHLFAPGVYYALGLPGSGLTFAIGGQVTPQLRSITDNQLVLQENAYRLGLICTYDIPLFTLWKTKR